MYIGQFKNDLRLTDEPHVLPESLADILLDGGYRNYLGDDGKVKPEREYDYEAFKWFVKNVLFCVNHELTELLSKQVSDMGYNNFITKTYTPSDEAFAVMLVVNYEKRWRSQVLHPTKDKNVLATDPLYATKYTSSKRGYCKLPWASEGIELFNDLVAKIEKLRTQPKTGLELETVLKEELHGNKKSRRKRKVEVIETRPVMGGALQQKLAKLKKNVVAV